MRAEIKEDCFLYIYVDNELEAGALRMWNQINSPKNHTKPDIVLNFNLPKEEEEGKEQ